MQEEMSIEEQVFSQSFSSMIRYLEEREALPDFSIEKIRGELEYLTIYQGQDWGGRGEIKNAEIDGQINGYLEFIARWEKRQKSLVM